MRARWRENISHSIPGEAGFLVGAIVLGDYSLLSAEAREMLQRAGLAHITSVSGLHVSLVISTVCLLVGGANGGWGWVSLVAAALFVMVSGAKASSIRALLTATVALFGRRRGARVDPWASLSIAWLCLLTLNPALLVDAGFVLSFSSVAGILLLARPLTVPVYDSGHGWRRWGRRLWNGFVVSVSAQLATAPASAAFFNTFSILCPVVNIVGVPLATMILVTGLAGCLLEAGRRFLPISGSAFLWVAGRAAEALLWLGYRAGRVSWAVLELAAPDWAATAAWVCALICLSCLVQLRYLPRPCRLLASRRALTWGLLAVSLQFLVVARHLWPPTGMMSITFFDVGQGDAILIQAPRGRTVLIDAGGRTRNWDASRLLVPQLKRLGIKKIDVAVNTHPHTDHLGGMAGILAGRRVQWMWESGRETETLTYAMYRQQLAEKGVPVRLARAGDLLRLGNVELQVLWPPADMAVHGDVNHHSIVLRVAFGQVAVMLMADAPVEVQRALLEREASVEAVLWKVSHQGARSSFDESFMEAVKPQVSVISVGSNAYGHPAPEVVERLQGMGVVCRTDLHGAVRFVTDGRTWRVMGRHGSSCRARGRL
jgi:competence protein ComEC